MRRLNPPVRRRLGARTGIGLAAAAALLLAACGGGGDSPTERAAAVGASACGQRVNNTVERLMECVTLDGVRAHQAALQAIADAHGGHRVAGSAGDQASVAYVQGVLQAAGYRVSLQPFQFQTFYAVTAPRLEQVAPPPAGPRPTTLLSYSGSGDVTAAVAALSAADATPGCEAGDFAGFPAGNIALIPRGACTFAIKATNAYNAGASAVVIYNNTTGEINGTLGNDFALGLVVTSVTQALGQEFAVTPGLVLRVQASTFRGLATAHNVLAESAGGDANNVVMVGGHLDSVNAGPGIQDNGSGVAAILETAVQMARVKPRNKLRFALWAAEESGLVGSSQYIDSLSEAERQRIALYLNFDMIASPNHVFFIYDGDDSDAVGAGAGPAGSAAIERLFETFYTQRNLPFKGTDFSGRSDYGPFIAVGIPAGGLFTGAEGIKTPEEAAIWGGTAGIAYDPCYHRACDTFDNVNLVALDTNADAVAYATLSLAMSTEAVNGQRGKGNFGPRVMPPKWQPYPAISGQ